MAQLSWMIPPVSGQQYVVPEVDDQLPDVDVEDLTDAQKIDFLTSVGDVADLGTDQMHYHG